MADNKPLLYFAYGSNMAEERIQARVPSAKKISNAVLPGYDLTFHKRGFDDSGKCDVVATDNQHDAVHGVIFELAAEEKAILDGFEGPRYRCEIVNLLDDRQQWQQAFAYLVADKAAHTDASMQPYHWYKHHVVYGAQQAGLPTAYIDALKAVEAIDDEDKSRHLREMSIYH